MIFLEINPVDLTTSQPGFEEEVFMSHKVTLIPGDGIGPEVTQATVRILEATGGQV